MTARYKLTKFRDKWNDGFYKPKFSDPNTVERQRSKHDVRLGLRDKDDLNDLQIRAEIQWEEEMRLANECHRMEEASPNHECRCHDPFRED